MPEPLSPLGRGGGPSGGRAVAEVRQMALDPGSGGGRQSSAPHPRPDHVPVLSPGCRKPFWEEEMTEPT